MPHSRDSLLDQLRAWGIRTTTHGHAPVFTVAQSSDLKAALPGAHTKNLFLKDRGGALFLVSASAHAVIDLVLLGRILGAKGRFSFGSAALLLEKLGVSPGSVTAFALINDPAQHVRFVLDQALLDAACVNFHPLRNDATTAISPSDLRLFLEKLGRTWDCVSFDAVHGPARVEIWPPAPAPGQKMD